MPNLPNAANNKDWKDHLLEGSLWAAYHGIKAGWDATSTIASPLHNGGKKLWQMVSGPGSRVETYWHSFSPEAKATAKKAMCAATYIAAGAAGFYAGSSLLAVPGIVTASSSALAPAVGLGTAGYRWIKHKTPLMRAVKEGAMAAAATWTGASSLATPAVAAGALIGLAAGNVTTAVTAMALNPDHSVMIQIPGQDHREDLGLLELSTLNHLEKPSSTKLESTLDELSGKICEFRAKHPEDVFWQDPLNKIIETISKPRLEDDQVTPKLSILLNIQRALEALPKCASNEQKIETVNRVLQKENFNINPAHLNSFLIDKIEAIPFDSKEYFAAKIKTDAQVELLVKRGSIMAIVFGIHVKLLKHADNDETVQTILQIVQDASKPDANLWDIYKLYLGNNLGFPKKQIAWILFWLAHDLGIASRVIGSFLRKAIAGFRSTVEPKNKPQLNTVFKQAFDQFSFFLDLYNGAADKYVEGNKGEELKGNLPVYQKMVIDRLGTDEIYQRVKAKYDLTPDGDFGQMMMKELCKDFSNVLIDRCLPKIKIWEKEKKIFLFGYVVRFGAWIIEFCTNKFLNKLVKKHLPSGIESIVESGLNQLLPTQYRVKIAITNGLLKLVNIFTDDLKKNLTKKPHRQIESSIIDGTAARILQTLKLKTLKENPTREQVIAYQMEVKNPKDPEIDKILEKLLAEGSKEFMYHLTEKPEQMEELFGDILTVTNEILEPTINNPTEEDCKASFAALKKATKKLAKDAIEIELKKQAIGPVTHELLDQYMNGEKDNNGQIVERGIYEIQKTKGIEIFKQLTTLSQLMSDTSQEPHLKTLDQYAETLKKFVFDVQGMNIDLYPRPAQHAFYRVFHSIYEQSIPLVEQAIELQKPMLNYDKLMNATKNLTEFEQIINQSPIRLRKELEEIERIGNNYNHQIPGFAEGLKILNQYVDGIEISDNAAEKERSILEKLATLGNPREVANNLKNDPRKWNEKIRSAIPLQDQEAIFALIRELQAGLKETPIQTKIENELIAIKNKYDARKIGFLAEKDSSIHLLREKIQEILHEYKQIRNQEFLIVQEKLMTLKLSTEKVFSNIKATTTPSITVPLSDLPKHAVDDLYTIAGVPIEKKLDPYIDAILELITDSDLYKGAARLVMRNIITKHKETPEEKAAREERLAELNPDDDQGSCLF